MSQQDENKQNEEQILENDLEELREEISELEWLSEENKKEIQAEDDEILKLKEMLARTQADYQNFKFRSERDREDMMFFLKFEILKKILPRVDDLERMIKNTPESEKSWALFEWILAMEKSLKRDLESMWVKPFVSVWEEVDPNKHEVMTQVSSEKPGFIVDEFEKWYLLWDRVLRVAKVVVWV